MPITSFNYKKGTDLSPWLWLNQYYQGASYHGTSCQFDGVRYIYWIVQSGTSTAGTASTTQLWRYDTWADGWQYMASPTSGSYGIDIEYDLTRNVLYMSAGNLLTSWQIFNLNTTSVNIAGTTCPAWALTTGAPVLPATMGYGGSFTMPTWQDAPGAIDVTQGAAPFSTTPSPGPIDSLTAASGSTTTVVNVSTSTANSSIAYGYTGLQIQWGAATTTTALRGLTYTISSVSNPGSLTVSQTMAAAPVAGDTFTVILPTGTSSGTNTTTTLNDTARAWTTNQYSNMDVVITQGTGAGQRRRLASNTATALTLAAAVTGNANTGAWTVTPDATSVYQIQPSSDFLYYQNGNNTTTLYKLDVTQTSAAAWVTLGAAPGGIYAGGNTVYPSESSPFFILAVRGNGTDSIYYYNIGTNAWTTPAVFGGSITWTTGSSSCLLHGLKKLFVSRASLQDNYLLDLTTMVYEPFPSSPYAAPGGYDGKRVHYVTTADGAQFLYMLRAGGQEYWRLPIEWLP